MQQLQAKGDRVAVIDDFSTGFAERISGIPTLEIDLADSANNELLALFMRQQNVNAVIHFAAKKQVGESVDRPAWYYQQNVGGLANLLLAMNQQHVSKLVFSSSAAVYGDTNVDCIVESHPTKPVNPYGATKLVGEQLLTASASAGQVSAVSLRYFNVAGALNPVLGDRAALNLVPMVFEKLEAGAAPVIFGSDYPTPDGSCIRDYIHVLDLADAHLAALDMLMGDAEPSHRVYNIGTGLGSSVRQIIQEILDVAGLEIHPTVAGRRAGDPARIVGDASKAQSELGWSAHRDVHDIESSAWASHSSARTVF